MLVNNSPVRPQHVGAFSASITHIWRTLLGIRRNAVAQLFDMMFMPALSLLLFTFIFGGAIAGSTNEYLHYFVPGVLAMTIIFMTIYTGTAITTDISKGIFDRFRTLPFWQPASIVGNLMGDAVRYVVAISASLAMAMLLGFRADGGVLGVVLASLALVVFAFSVSWLFALLGTIAKQPETVSGTSAVALYPLVFTSNIFAETSTMPNWMQVIVNLNPITHAANAVRGLMHGNATAEQLLILGAICAGFIVVFAPLTIYLYLNKK